MSEDIKWQEEASGLIHFGNGLRVDIGETADAIAHRLRTDAAALAAAEAERDRLREAMQTIVQVDKTRYEHHEPRPDGALPRTDGGTCWLTPKEIARAALATADRPAPTHGAGGEKE